MKRKLFFFSLWPAWRKICWTSREKHLKSAENAGCTKLGWNVIGECTGSFSDIAQVIRRWKLLTCLWCCKFGNDCEILSKCRIYLHGEDPTHSQLTAKKARLIFLEENLPTNPLRRIPSKSEIFRKTRRRWKPEIFRKTRRRWKHEILKKTRRWRSEIFWKTRRWKPEIFRMTRRWKAEIFRKTKKRRRNRRRKQE